MSDLLDLYKQLGANYTDTLKATQDAQANAIALQNARRAQQEREGLKALYAQQANPSYQAIGALSPEYAQEYLKNQFAMQKDIVGMQHQQAQTGDIERKANEESEKIRIGQAVAIVNQYDQDKASGMPEPQARAKYNDASGRALSMLKQRGMIPPDFPAFDPDVMNPEAVRLAGEGRNFYTEKAKQRQEYQKSLQGTLGTFAAGLGPQKSIWNEQLQKWETPPSLPTQGLTNAPMPSRELQVEPGAVDPMENYLSIINNPNTPPEVRAFATEKAQALMPKINTSEATSEQNLAKIAEQKANVAGAEKTAQIEATEKAADKKAIETYLRGPKPEAVRNLIKESIEGDVQSGIARLGKFFGVAIPGGGAKEALNVITQQMAKALPYAPGSASDIDVKNRLLTVGNPASDEPITNRLRAMDEVFRDAEAYIVQKGELSEDQILDAVANGYLSESSAVEMINKGMKTSTGVK